MSKLIIFYKALQVSSIVSVQYSASLGRMFYEYVDHSAVSGPANGKTEKDIPVAETPGLA